MLVRALRTGRRALCSRCLATAAAPREVSQATDAAQLLSDWPRLEIPSLPPPRFIDPQGTGKRPKREPGTLAEAVLAVKANATANFNETVDVCIALGTNPKRGDQMVRGACALPHGTGKEPRICVFANEADAADARAAGADMIGDETFIDTLLREGSSALKFDACLGTRAMMPKLTKIARLLGPRGLMPNPKTGTLIEPGGMRTAIEKMKKGQVQYRADRFAMVHAGIGKVSFKSEHLAANFTALASALLSARPKGVKGSGLNGYFLSVKLSSTMGPGIPVTLSSVAMAMQQSSARTA